jgi:hypothetical protein
MWNGAVCLGWCSGWMASVSVDVSVYVNGTGVEVSGCTWKLVGRHGCYLDTMALPSPLMYLYYGLVPLSATWLFLVHLHHTSRTISIRISRNNSWPRLWRTKLATKNRKHMEGKAPAAASHSCRTNNTRVAAQIYNQLQPHLISHAALSCFPKMWTNLCFVRTAVTSQSIRDYI